MVLNTATLNFGGINASKLEFVDFSTEESKEFFQNIQSHFESFADDAGEITLRRFLMNLFTTNQVSYINYLLGNVSKFMRSCLTDDFLVELVSQMELEDRDEFVAHFDQGNLGEVSLNCFITNVLKRDKGIGGFEQLCQERPTNIGNINQFLDKTSDGRYTFNRERYLGAVRGYYFEGSGIERIKLNGLKSYRDIFLKGRKEGADGGTRNYYTYFTKEDSRNGDVPSHDRSTMFHCVANLVMMLYDLISMEIIMSKGGVVPKNIPEKMSPEELGDIKTRFVYNLVIRQDLDVLFVTECIPDIFGKHTIQLSNEGYDIVYGPETSGLCNAIIYRIYDGEILTPVEVDAVVYPDAHEFKESPLHISNEYGTMNLICYHANGKGVTVKKSLEETSFYTWLSNMDGHVILGGDLNMDYKKVGEKMSDLLELGEISRGAFSCYKQRSPLQAQYDKAGVFDTKFCDYIITKGFERTGVKVIRATTGGVAQILNADHNLSPDELVIPNNTYPFEHYIVTDQLVMIPSGFEFFTKNIPVLSFMDGVFNWFFGY
jgi:hypothetical protein